MNNTKHIKKDVTAFELDKIKYSIKHLLFKRVIAYIICMILMIIFVLFILFLIK